MFNSSILLLQKNHITSLLFFFFFFSVIWWWIQQWLCGLWIRHFGSTLCGLWVEVLVRLGWVLGRWLVEFWASGVCGCNWLSFILSLFFFLFFWGFWIWNLLEYPVIVVVVCGGWFAAGGSLVMGLLWVYGCVCFELYFGW